MAKWFLWLIGGLFCGIALARSATPTLVQHVSTFSNWDPDIGQPGNPYLISLPNRSGGGNVLVLGISYPFSVGRTFKVTDDGSNVWVIGATTPANPSNEQIVSCLCYALNVATGTQKITVSFDTNIYNFQAVASEFYNVATVAAAEAASVSSTSTAPNVSAGSFTTTNAGELVYFYALDTRPWNFATRFVAGAGFTLLSADLELGSVAQYAIQPSAGVVRPVVTALGGADPFNAVALGLKAANAGTAPAAGIRIVHVYHVDYQNTNALQFPSTGNLLFCATAFSTFEQNIFTMATSPANTWTKAPVLNSYEFPQIWFATNASTSPDVTIIPGRADDGNGVSLVFYDIAGADPSPCDSLAGLPTSSTLNTDNSNLLDMPILIPSTSNGLVIAVMSNGYGPTTGMVGQGFTLDTITYGNEDDADLMDNADGYAHYYNVATTPVSFGWVMNSSTLPESSAAVAIAFRAAPNVRPSLSLSLPNGPGGPVRIMGSGGVPNGRYTIEAAASLIQPAWQTRGTITADSFGSFEYLDSAPIGIQTFFYRARAN